MIALVARINESVNLLVGSEITVQGSEVPHIIRLWYIRIKNKQNSSEKVDRVARCPAYGYGPLGRFDCMLLLVNICFLVPTF